MKHIVLFGIDDNFKSDNVLEFIILYAEYFICRGRFEREKKGKKSSVMCIQKGVDKKIWNWGIQPTVETDPSGLLIRLGLL